MPNRTCHTPVRSLLGALALAGLAIVVGGCDGFPMEETQRTLSSVATTGSAGGAGFGSAIGPGCATNSSVVCIGVKYVAYEDGNGIPIVSQATAISNIAQVNAIWKQCGIQFEISDYRAVRPSDFGLTGSANDTNAPRRTFDDPSTFLIVSLTGTVPGADAWTNTPGASGPFGSILDSNVATYVPVIAHELGHYVGLDHVGDVGNLMTPAPYTTSTRLTTSQCSTARATANQFWQKMLR